MSITISELPAIGGQPNDASFFPIVESGITKRVTYGNSRAKKITELDAQTDAPADAALLRLSVSGTEKKIAFSNLVKDLRVTVPINISMFMDSNTKNLTEQWNGALIKDADNQALNSGSPINTVAHGIGKIIIVPLAGATPSGTITVTGDTVDRNTGVVTEGDTQEITLDGLATDASTTDAEGTTIYDITDAYITSKWLSGAYSITTTDVSLTDVDIYHCSFEQVNDQPNMTLETFDINLKATNANAWFYAYLYTIVVTGSKVDVQNAAALSVPQTDSVADKYYRLRQGNIGVAIDGTKDGFFVDLEFGPDTLSYWENISAKVWFHQTLSLTNI